MHDFIAIGEAAIDAFIKLEGAQVVGEPDTPDYKLCIPFATKVPYESVTEVPAVANASNAAVSAARLGLQSALVANVGEDQDSKKCFDVWQKEGVDTTYIGVQPSQKTNYHYVLWYEDDRTILQKHASFQYSLPSLLPAKWLYLTSLGESSLPFHTEIGAYLKAHPETKLAFQPGIFQIKFGYEALKEIYAETEILFCNIEEAGQILGVDTLGREELLKRVHALGPKIVIITDGPRGSYAYDGEKFYQQDIYPDPKPPVERTGAGDAFASTCVSALALGEDLQSAMKWGSINSMSVVQEIGAQKGLLTREELQKYL